MEEQPKSKQSRLQSLTESGIPLSRCVFNSAIDNAKLIPTNNLSDNSDNKERRAEMWLMANGNVLCRQNGVYFGVSSSLVGHYKFKV